MKYVSLNSINNIVYYGCAVVDSCEKAKNTLKKVKNFYYKKIKTYEEFSKLSEEVFSTMVDGFVHYITIKNDYSKQYSKIKNIFTRNSLKKSEAKKKDVFINKTDV